jgi:hypothetical protein
MLVTEIPAELDAHARQVLQEARADQGAEPPFTQRAIQAFQIPARKHLDQ